MVINVSGVLSTRLREMLVLNTYQWEFNRDVILLYILVITLLVQILSSIAVVKNDILYINGGDVTYRDVNQNGSPTGNITRGVSKFASTIIMLLLSY